MERDFILIILGFIEGFALILSPCILPILPIILASSLTGSKLRPLGVILGFILTFTLFAYFSRQFVYYSGVNLNTIRYFSYSLLILLGLIMLSSTLSQGFSHLTQRLANLNVLMNHKSDFISGFFVGALIAIIWTPCAGPILAAVIVQTVLQKTNLNSFFTLLAFALGTALPMWIIAVYGRNLINGFQFFKTKATLFRKTLGLIILLSVAYLIYAENRIVSSSIPQSTIKTSTFLEDGLWHPYPAPEITGIEAWINSPPLKLSELKGKVILIDFWTFSCINCLRTLPYLKNWFAKYRDKGLVIIGIHSPEFDFEKNLANVESAVKRYGILYPVALDNRFLTWSNFNNRFWPAHYLINKEGKVVYKHFGEGAYEVTENNIRFLLGINELNRSQALNNESLSFIQTPETYLGYARANRKFSPYLIHDKAASYLYPKNLPSNAWGLEGSWIVKEDKIKSAEANASVQIHFNARKVFVVMANQTAKPIRVNIRIKNHQIINKSLNVDKDSIYEILAANQLTSGLLELTSTAAGLEIYTFSFGN